MEYMENQMDDLITGANLQQEESNSFKLISMTDFVLEQTELLYDKNQSKLIHRIVNYAQFLKQPLTLGMFVPVDEEGNVMEDLKYCCTSNDCGCMGMPVNVSSQEDIDNFYKAKDRVLFKGFHKEFNAVISPSGGYLDTGNLRYKTIETIAGVDLELTQSAIKNIGL